MCNVNMSQADACQECALKCTLIHKKKRDPSSIVSSFFKVMIDDQFFKFLPVPPRFAPRLASLVDQEAHVEDSSGRKWTITLSTVEGCLAFERGWHAFSLDHGIELGDMVIVNYILDSHFVVQIYGRSGCEKLNLPSDNNTIQKKRIRITTDSVSRVLPCSKSDTDPSTFFNSGSDRAAIPSNMETEGSSREHLESRALKKHKNDSHQISVSKKGLDEPSLMIVNRDTPVAGEGDRSTLFDMFASEISNTKPAGKVDSAQKGIGSSKVEDMTDDIAFADVLKDTCDAKMDGTNGNGNYEVNRTMENGHKRNSGTTQGNGNLEVNMIQFESAENLENPEQQHNGCSNNKDMMDYDSAFEDLLGDSLDLKMSEERNDAFKWTSKTDHKNDVVTTEGNGFFAINSTDFTGLRSDQVRETSEPPPKTTDPSLSDLNVIERNIKEMNISAKPRSHLSTSGHRIDGNNGISIPEKHGPAIIGSHSMDIPSDKEASCSVAAIPVHQSIGQNLKIPKNEHKEFNPEQVGIYHTGSASEPNITGLLRKNLNATTSAGEVRQIVKAEPGLLLKNLYATTSAGEVRQIVKAEPVNCSNLNATTSAGEVLQIVKAESVDHTLLEVSCFVTPDNEFVLELPEGFPYGCTKFKEKVVVLRDPRGRSWPVRFLEKDGLKALVYGWKSFRMANGIRSGDECVFALVDQSECIYRVQINHK